MAVFAGEFLRGSDETRTNQLRSELANLVGRNDATKVRTIQHPGSVIVVSTRFSDLCTVVSDGRGTTVVAGDPIITRVQNRKPASVSADVSKLHHHFAADDPAGLVDSTGAYCGLFVARAGNMTRLFTDRIGLRQIYFAGTQETLYFSSALWILEQINGLSRPLDINALFERIT